MCGGKRCKDCPAPTLLPESQPGYAAFLACSTQWRYSHNGRTGLDYSACYALLDRQLPAWRAASPGAFEGCTVDALMADVQVVEWSTLHADGQRRQREREQRELEQQNRR